VTATVINDSTTTQEQLLGFNVLIFDSATVALAPVAIALESVTATVIDLYVYWKPGFRVRLEALLSSSLVTARVSIAPVGFKFKFNGLTNTRQPLIAFVGDLDLTAGDWITAVDFQGLVLEAVTVGINDSTVWLNRQQL